MFTVLICDKHIEDDCRGRYYIYLKPFLDNKEFAFCSWNTEADSFDEAVPDLKNIIRNKKEWRAVVVNDGSTWDFDSINKRNPFDYVDSDRIKCDYRDFESIIKCRELKEKALEKAFLNPLTKLSVWLCGSPFKTAPDICYEGNENIFEISQEKEYFSALKKIGITSEEAECDRIRLMQYRNIADKFESKGELFNSPKNVLTIAERTKDVEMDYARTVWESHTEFEYSRFYEDNLYPSKLRYLLYDMPCIKGVKCENSYFNFLTLLLLLATNEYPNDTIRSERVYSVNVEIDSECVKDLCHRYSEKLAATLKKIDDITEKLSETEGEPLDREIVQEYFESKVTVPVEVEQSFSTENLRAKMHGIGLANDCPTGEYQRWDNEYHEIGKQFIRYLREPRRAVKKAAGDSFRRMNKNEDERAMQLNEFQREDVLIHMQNEEADMIATTTTHLFDTVRYRKSMDEADRIIRKEINQRMTRKKTVYTGLIAALAYFLGFIPMFWSNIAEFDSYLFMLVFTSVSLGAFLACGFVYLFSLRVRLKKRLAAFNDTVESIVAEIDGSLSEFSKYLSHACNVMRCHSALTYKDKTYLKSMMILGLHKRVISERIKELYELFSNYVGECEVEISSSARPYEYDFTKMAAYEYTMPYTQMSKKIEFIQPGNTISVPVDYLGSVTVMREELYD